MVYVSLCVHVSMCICICVFVCVCVCVCVSEILMSMHRALQITSEKLAILDCNCFIKSTMN